MAKRDEKKLSRRGFCKTAVVVPALLPGINPYDAQSRGPEGQSPASQPTGAEFDLTRQSAALQPDQVVDSACQFCNSLCRLKVHLKRGRIINIVGEPNDPVQAGSLCVKGPMMTQLVYNRHRLTQPMKRVGGEKGSPDSKFAPISWDEALTIIAQKFLALRDAGEARSIANKTSGRLPRGTGSLVNRFFTLLGSPNDTDVGPVCNDAGGNALAWTFGLGNFTNGYGKDEATGKEDLGSSKYFLFLGTNQAETHPLENTPGMGGMTEQRMEKRVEPLRWPCPSTNHPGVSTLYLDHPSWYEAAAALDPANKGKRFLTPSGKIEIYTPEMEQKLAAVGHHALPIFYTHPEVTGRNATIEYSTELAKNPVNPQALTPKVKIGGLSSGEIHKEYPLMGMVGRPSVVHFAGVTQWTYIGKQMNGLRLIQIHPNVAQKAGVKDGDAIIVESPRGAVTGTALLWPGIREDTIFVPNTFGPMQKMAQELGTPDYEPANHLLDDQYYDNLSGQQSYKCFACRVRKA